MAYQKTNPNGQATMANSAPVVLASDHSDVKVAATSLPLPTGAATEATLGAIKTAVEKIDDSNFTSGDAIGTTVPVDLIGLRDSAGNARYFQGMPDNADAQGASAGGNTLRSGSLLYNFNGTTWDRVRGDTTNGLTVNLGTNNDVRGDVAHDAADAGEPVKIGFKAYTLDGTAPQTAVAEADRVNGIADLHGRQYVATEHPFFFHVSADYATAQTNTSVKAAPGAGLSIYIKTIQISNGATAGNVTLLDGSGGTVLYEVYPGINGGATLHLDQPIKLTANTALCITSTTVTTHSVFISGFIA